MASTIKYKILMLSICLPTAYAVAQKYTSEKSTILFYSNTVLEDIKGENTNTKSLIDLSTKAIAFSVPIQKFQFEESLMKEHFNEKYLNSDKYPTATFQGTMAGLNIASKEVQATRVNGTLTIHGIAKQVAVDGTIHIHDGVIAAHAKFLVILKDYKISVPKLLWKKIAEQVEVTIDFEYKQIK